MRGDVAVHHWADEGEQVRNGARARVGTGARAWAWARARARVRVWVRVRVRVSGSVGELGRVPGQTKATRAQSLLAPLARHDIMTAPHAYLGVRARARARARGKGKGKH